MESVIPQRAWGLTVIAALALAQSVVGVLRALQWIDIGSDLMGQGLLILPAVGLVAIFRGMLIGTIALLYVVFACGAFLRCAWAWWLGLFVALISVLLVMSVALQGEMVGRALPWLVVPALITIYLLTGGRQDLSNDHD